MVLNKVITALDLSAIDETIIQFVSRVAEVFGMQQFYFIHIVKDLTKPENIDLDFHRLFSPDHPLDEKIKASLQKEVVRAFQSPDTYAIEVEVHEGKPYQKLLHWADIKNVDLVVVGKKKQSEGSGITSRRLARNLKCSILFVPEVVPAEIRRIVVPIDFSEHSVKALQLALKIAKSDKEVTVTALHVIETFNMDNYPGSVAYPQYLKTIKEAHKASYYDMLKAHDINSEKIKLVMIDDPFMSIAGQLERYLSDYPVDTVIIGARGHSRFENFLYGSVTEQFVERYDSAPVMVVR